MQRLSSGFVAVLSILALSTVPACKGEQADAGASKAGEGDASKAGAKQPDAAKQPDDGAAASADASAAAGAEAGAGADAAVDANAEAGEPEAEAGAAAEAGAEAGAPAEDLVPALFDQAKSLDTDDAAAQKALTDAIAAGAAKLDAAKVANERGESLMTKGESERAEAFFVWARDAHSLYADPVYNLAKLSAYAGDLELAKEHLAELEKRGNKKLMKKVGVEPAFAPLHDDPDVRKIYEQ